MPLRFVSLLLAAGPLALVVVFGVLRDAPPRSTCGDVTPPAVVDAYQTGLGWIAGAAALVAAAVLVVALRAADGTLWRVRVAIALVAVALGAFATVRLTLPVTQPVPFRTGLLLGAAVAAIAWVGLTRLSGVRLTPATIGLAAVAALPALVAGAALAAVLLVASIVLILPLPVLALAAIAALWSRGARVDDVPLAAAFHGAVVVPAIAILVVSQGSGPWIC